MLLPNTNGNFQLSAAIECCLATLYIPFHDFCPPIAAYLCSRNSRFLGCLLSLLGFFCSPVNSQKKRNSYLCLPFTVSLSWHCKSSLRSRKECISGLSSAFSTFQRDYDRDSKTVCDKNGIFTKGEGKKRPFSAATISCSDYSVLPPNILIKKNKAPTKKLIKHRAHLEFKLVYEKHY